ncbi:MAG: MIP/aquaporin family protein [Pseudomonadota bacterium]
MNEALRAYLAEGLGTAFLLMTIVGSGIMGESMADGQVGVALLPHAIAIGAMLFVLITVFGPISGAHFNPAVTMVFLIRGEIALPRAAIYVGVQITSAVIGMLLAHLMFDLDLLQISEKGRTGPGQWVAEVTATFGLVMVILGGLRTAPHLVPVLVGAYICAALWFTASTSFANPAVTLARALTDTFTGIDPEHVIAFWVAQLAGAALAIPVANIVWAPAEK